MSAGFFESPELIRLRCWCDSDTKCWHYRTADGRKMLPDGNRQAIWVPGRGTVPITKAAWEAAHQRRVPDGLVAYRICRSYDCANPKHIKVGTRAQFGLHVARSGAFKGQPARVIASRRSAAKRLLVHPEQRVWIVESTQSHAAVARALGCSACLVQRVRKQARQRLVLNASSIFAIGLAMNEDRRAA